MRCPGCDTPAPENARFCGACGCFLGRTCPTCDARAAVGARFCIQCGTKLDAGERGAAVPLSMSGERKYLTLLFADVADSLALVSELDAEEARQLTEAVIERLVDAVVLFGGIVNQVSGDGIMALFGAPASLEDHALRACHAALAMQETLRLWQPHEARGHAVRVRVGINTGEVVVAERGRGFDFQYTTFGSAAHIASRMEQSAPRGGILLSAATHAHVSSRVHGQDMGPIRVKGLAAPVRAFLLTGVADGRSNTSSQDGGTPLVGREAPLAELRALAKGASSGQGRAAVLVGEPGSGKSRLCRHVLASFTDEWRLRATGGHALVRPAPYRGAVDWLRPFIAEAGGFEAWLEALGPGIAPHAQALRALLAGEDEAEAWLALPIGERDARLTTAIVAALRREADRTPLVLLGEDLHWMDPATTAVLAQLVRGMGDAALFVLVTTRPEGLPEWADTQPSMVLELCNLAADDTRLLLDGVLGCHASLDTLKADLFRRTGGSPFFLEETVKALRAAGALVGTSGAFRLDGAVQHPSIPPTVQDLLASRIDQLPGHAKHVLRSAAVLGSGFDAGQVARLAGPSTGDSVAQLVRMGFLVDTSAGLAFCHDLCRDVAYGGLLTNARRHLHAHALAILEADGVAESDMLALHAHQGEVWDKALRHSQAAGRLSLARSSLQAALPFFEDALAALRHLPDSDATRRTELGLRLDLRNTLFSLGRAASIGPHLAAAEALARRLADTPSLARARSQRSHHAWQMGRWDEALLLGQEALELARALGDVGLEASTRFFMGLASHAMGQFEAAAELLARNVAQLDGALARERFGFVSLCSVVSGCYLSICLTELGRFPEAEAAARDAHAVAADAGNAFDRGQADLAVAGVQLMQGRAGSVTPRLEAAMERCLSSNVSVLLPRLSAALAVAYALEGRVEDAVLRADQREEDSGAAIRAMSMLLSGEALLVAGRADAARVRAEALVAHSRATTQPGAEAWGLHLLASALAAEGCGEEADKVLTDASRLAQPRGMRALLARCSLRRAVLARVRGRSDAGRLVEAARLDCRELGMDAWTLREAADAPAIAGRALRPTGPD